MYKSNYDEFEILLLFVILCVKSTILQNLNVIPFCLRVEVHLFMKLVLMAQ